MTILGEPQEFERPAEKTLWPPAISISAQATLWISEQEQFWDHHEVFGSERVDKDASVAIRKVFRHVKKIG